MTVFTARATNVNGVDADITVDDTAVVPQGQQSQQEAAIFQLATAVDTWRSDTSVSAPS